MGAEGDPQGSLEDELLRLWGRIAATAASASPERGSDRQLVEELADALRELPHHAALADRQEALATAQRYLHGLRQACEALGVVRDASESLPTAWESLASEEAEWAHMAACRGIWVAEWPSVPRVAHKVPKRVDRLRALGNAVVPQVAELVGRRLAELDAQLT